MGSRWWGFTIELCLSSIFSLIHSIFSPCFLLSKPPSWIHCPYVFFVSLLLLFPASVSSSALVSVLVFSVSYSLSFFLPPSSGSWLKEENKRQDWEGSKADLVIWWTCSNLESPHSSVLLLCYYGPGSFNNRMIIWSAQVLGNKEDEMKLSLFPSTRQTRFKGFSPKCNEADFIWGRFIAR